MRARAPPTAARPVLERAFHLPLTVGPARAGLLLARGFTPWKTHTHSASLPFEGLPRAAVGLGIGSEVGVLL